MGQLQGLTGVANDRKIDCLFIKKGSDIEVILENNYAATTANSNGALNVYKDDAGNIRCEAMRHLTTIESEIFDGIKPAIAWVNKWLPKIKKP